MMSRRASWVFAVSLLTLVGCASKSSSSSGGSNDAVQEGTDANGAESDAEGLSTTLIGGGGGTLALASEGELTTTGDVTTQGIGDAAKAYFIPSGCLAVTDDSAKSQATYVFNDCTGPRGLVHVTGTVTVGYQVVSATELKLSYAATGLKINKATIDWTASADVTANGADREMIWDGQLDGTTRNGRDFTRKNHKDYKWAIGGTCLGVDGSSDGTVTGHELKTDVTSFKICKGECPEAGSEIKVTDVTTSKVYDVTWNATNATYTGPDGKAITYTPLCAL